MLKNPNLLVIGASGGVGNAFLHHLVNYRDSFGDIVLLDRNKKILKDIYIDHKRLNYKFIHKDLKFPKGDDQYIKLLKDYKIDIVLDITDIDSIKILEATDKAGVSYINTAMNDEKLSVKEIFLDVYPRKDKIHKAPHILCTGMNPGNVNMWVRYGIEKFGIPKQIVHFEYDTSKISKKWQPMMTWSVHEFLVEMVRDPSGVALGSGEVKDLFPNALENHKNLRKILEPIMKLDSYPDGLIVLHEENMSISYKYDIPCKFYYAINPQTTKELLKIYESKGDVFRKDLILGNNTSLMLDGSDNIGLIMEYKDKLVYYYNTVSNLAIIGTNATYTQVIIGIFSGLFTIMFDKIKPGTYFVEDLYDSYYKHFMFENMRVEEFVFKKGKNHPKLLSYNPMIKVKPDNKFKHRYII